MCFFFDLWELIAYLLIHSWSLFFVFFASFYEYTNEQSLQKFLNNFKKKMRWFKRYSRAEFLEWWGNLVFVRRKRTKLFFYFFYMLISKCCQMPASFHEVTGKRVCSRCWYTFQREEKKIKKKDKEKPENKIIKLQSIISLPFENE